MNARPVLAGDTNVTTYVFIQDSSSATGAGLTGLVYNSSGLTCYYVKELAAAAQLSLATQTTTGAHSDGGFVEIDSTNMPGWYRLDLSDTIVAASGDVAIHLHGAANMVPAILKIPVSGNVALATTTLALIADNVLGRATSDHESNWTESYKSLYGVIAKLTHKLTAPAGGSATVFKSNDSSTLTTLTVTRDGSAEPITALE